MNKLWIDDERPAPDESWMIARTSNEAINFLIKYQFNIVSFDHDLGGDDDGYKVIAWIENAVRTMDYSAPYYMFVHSMNGPGRDKIKAAINSIQKYMGR
jgi:NAD+-processing family protein with receiver domain